MKRYLASLAIPLCLLGAPAFAVCGVSQQLDRRGETLDNWVPVSKRDRDFIQSFGIPLTTKRSGAGYVVLDDLFATLQSSGCNEDLVKWTIRKGRPRGGSLSER